MCLAWSVLGEEIEKEKGGEKENKQSLMFFRNGGKDVLSRPALCRRITEWAREKDMPPVAEAELRCSKPGSISK